MIRLDRLLKVRLEYFANNLSLYGNADSLIILLLTPVIPYIDKISFHQRVFCAYSLTLNLAVLRNIFDVSSNGLPLDIFAQDRLGLFAKYLSLYSCPARFFCVKY